MAECSKQLKYKAAKINELLEKIDKGYVLTKDLLDKLVRVDESVELPEYTASLEFVDSEDKATVEKVPTIYGYNFNFKLPKAEDISEESKLEFGNGLICENGVVSLVPPNFTVNINMELEDVEPSGKVTGCYPDLVLDIILPKPYQPPVPEEPVDADKIYYGYVQYDETGIRGYALRSERDFANITKELLNKGNINCVDAGKLDKTDIGIVPAGSRIYVLTPEGFTAAKDNGVGVKVPFDVSGGSECCNGEVKVEIDGCIYKVFGEDVTSDGQFFIYVD